MFFSFSYLYSYWEKITPLSSAKGFRLSRYPQKHSFVHVVADKQDLKLDVESFFLCIGLVKKLSSWFFLHSEAQ